MNLSPAPPRLPLRVRRYGRRLRPDGTTVFLNGYVVVSPGDEDYEIEYTIARYRHCAHGRRMPYAGHGEALPPVGGWLH